MAIKSVTNDSNVNSFKIEIFNIGILTWIAIFVCLLGWIITLYSLYVAKTKK